MCFDGRGDFVFQAVQLLPNFAASLRLNLTEALHQLGNAAFAPERSHTYLFQGIQIGRTCYG